MVEKLPMRTIKYERTSEFAQVVVHNPFTVRAIADIILKQGHVEVIPTGLKFSLSDDLRLHVEKSLGDLTVTLHALLENDELLLLVVAKRDCMILKQNNLAILKITQTNHPRLRFIEFKEGKRQIYGGSESVSDASPPKS